MRNMSLNLKSLMTSVAASAKFVSVATPTVIAAALLTTWFAFSQVEQVLTLSAKSAAAKSDFEMTRSATVNKVPLTAVGYEDARRIVGQGNPSVVVNLNKEKNGLTVSVTDAALMPEWLYLISTMQAYQPGLMWNAEKICLKKCEGGEAAYAELKAFTQQVTIQ